MAVGRAPDDALADDVSAIRGFNRFYTQRIGVLDEAPLNGPFSLTEGRVLFELAHRDAPTASELRRDLGLDQGYLSRILARFERQRLVKRAPSSTDKRQSHIKLTAKGRAAFAAIDVAWQTATEGLVEKLPPIGRRDLVTSMRRVHSLLAEDAAEPVTLRDPRVGDMGLLVHRHAVLYAEQFGWNMAFEAVVAEIVAAFVTNFDPARERCWIAERNGGIVGSIFLVSDSETVGRLRLLYVEPNARGLGLGRRLVDECIEQARKVGYGKLVLWTYEVLRSAGRIYGAAGFRVVNEERQHAFGQDIVSQDYELTL